MPENRCLDCLPILLLQLFLHIVNICEPITAFYFQRLAHLLIKCILQQGNDIRLRKDRSFFFQVEEIQFGLYMLARQVSLNPIKYIMRRNAACSKTETDFKSIRACSFEVNAKFFNITIIVFF